MMCDFKHCIHPSLGYMYSLYKHLSLTCTHRKKYVERQENKFITLFMHPNWLYSNVISREMKKTGNSGFIKRRKECYNLEIFRDDFTTHVQKKRQMV